MAKIIPELVVAHMAKSMEFYTTLGFVQDNEGIVDDKGSQWYSLAMGDTTVWLLREDTVEGFDRGLQRGYGIHLYLTVSDVDLLYSTLQTSGARMNIVQEIETQWYGLREFRVADPDGYVWTINMPVDAQATDAVDGIN
ncbi:MAG: VOC family protein [Chloroflexota bacterium]